MADRTEYMKKWREDNKEAVKAYEANYNARPQRKKAQRENDRKRSQSPYRKEYVKTTHKKVSKASKIKRKYGITIETFELIKESQSNVCAICSKEFGISNKTVDRCCVDHCHKTGQVRGLLCSGCNVAIGLLEEDVYRIGKAITYLNKWGD